MQLLLDDKRMVQVSTVSRRKLSRQKITRRCSSLPPAARAVPGRSQSAGTKLPLEFADKGEGRWTLRLTPTTTRWIKFSTPSISPGKPIWRALA